MDNNSIIKTTHKTTHSTLRGTWSDLSGSPHFSVGEEPGYEATCIIGPGFLEFMKCMRLYHAYTIDREIFTLKKIFMLINFCSSVRSLKFFCVNCFVHVLNFHDWSKPWNCLTVEFSQSTVLQCTLQHLLKQFAVTAMSLASIMNKDKARLFSLSLPESVHIPRYGSCRHLLGSIWRKILAKTGSSSSIAKTTPY